ncbi:MAG: phytoene/squalene synthase family protein [Kofleriaceae bacterium]|nr:phytoene/squalene synthase family protein [Kofleriaceae bacterium]
MSTALAQTVADAHVTMAQNSKSFALAARVFTPATRDAAAVIYAYCRYVDDAIDSVTGPAQLAALQQLRAELDTVYADQTGQAPDAAATEIAVAPATRLSELTKVVQRHHIPRHYFDELLRGMQRDVEGQHYRTVAELIDYCYCVASVVGLIMCHVMGTRQWRDPAQQTTTLNRAAHLGIAMQLTNICRDVDEDKARGRVYLPDEIMAQHGVDLHTLHTDPKFSAATAMSLRPAVATLLQLAERYYRSGQRGTLALPLRSAFAVRAARRIYAAIGKRLATMHFDITAGRAIVSKRRKLGHVVIAALQTISEIPQRIWYYITRRGFAAPTQQLEAAHVTQPE